MNTLFIENYCEGKSLVDLDKTRADLLCYWPNQDQVKTGQPN